MVMMVGLGPTHIDGGLLRGRPRTGAPSPMPLSPQVPWDVMAWLWLSCLLLPTLVVSGACLPSPIRAALIWGP